MNDKLNKEQFNKANTLINKHLCNFIAYKFLREPKNEKGKIVSQNEYSYLVGLSSSTISKIKSSSGYDLPISTIYNICRHEKYSLKKLFQEFEDKFGVNIPE